MNWTHFEGVMTRRSDCSTCTHTHFVRCCRGSCGYVGTAAYEDVAVKRIRSFEYNGELHLTMLSRCSIATVPWASVTGAAASATAAAGTWPKIQPQTESLFAKNCPELPV